MAKKGFFEQFISDLGDPNTSIAADGTASSEFSGYVDTGSYIFNAALSGSLFGGMPNNKAIVLGGATSVGKSFFALAIVKNFLASDPKARVFYADTESSITNDMMIERGIDVSRVAKSEPDSIENFRTIASTLLDNYIALDKSEKFPLLLVLDSLTAMPSRKEITDIAAGSDTKDMTKPGLLKGMFRVLRLKLAKCQVPMIITGHTYSQIGAYVPTQVLAGGSGAAYASDSIVMLSKSKERNADKEVVGNIIKVKMDKSRLSREQTVSHTRIMFDGGLDRYYGLLELAVESGLVTKNGNKYEFSNGSKVFEKAVWQNPEKFFTQELLEQLDPYVQSIYKYTNTVPTSIATTDIEDVVE